MSTQLCVKNVTAYLYGKRHMKLHTCLSAGLALGLFFIAAEEISWGQRVIGFKGPDTFVVGNRQGEFNIHNQGFIQNNIHYLYMAIGLYGAFSRLIVTRVVPHLRAFFYEITPPIFLFFYFISVFLYYFLNEYLNVYYEIYTTKRVGMGKWQEVAELFLSAGFFLFTLSALLQSWRKK